MENILNELIDNYQEDMISDIKALVKIPSILDENTVGGNAPFGRNVRCALDEVISISKKLGFDVKDYDGYAASVKLGKEGREVGVLCHADVVPVDDKWNTEPFEAVIKEGKIYGRGTVDDKGPLVAVLYAMKAIKESGLPVEGCVNHIIGCNEETGHKCIKYYLEHEKQPEIGFSPDGLFPVIHGEKGIIRYTIVKRIAQEEPRVIIKKICAGTVVNVVPDSAKVWLDGGSTDLNKIEEVFSRFETKCKKKCVWENETCLRLEFGGISAHAMQPWLGENAILPMLQFLHDLPEIEYDMKCFLGSLETLYGDGWKGENMGISCADKLSGNLSQNMGVFQFEKGMAEVRVDVRCPIHADLEMVWKTIRINCEKYELGLSCQEMRKPLYIPKEAALVEKLLSVYHEMTGDCKEAITIGGGTYCRDVEGFVSFGPVFPYEKEVAHEANEYIGVGELLLSAKIYAQALYALIKPK